MISFPNTTTEADRSFLDEITRVGQSKLRSTKRPRSPGGTPIKTPAKPAVTPSANDRIQQALMSRIKTINSTPVRPKPKQQQQPSATSDPNDFSNQWSDVHSFEDPDFTTGDIGSVTTPDPASSPSISEGFNPSSSKISTPKPGKGATSGGGGGVKGTKRSWRSLGRKKTGKGRGASPNTSTAV